MSMKNSNGTIGNRTRDLPACSVVSQPTAPPRAPSNYIYSIDCNTDLLSCAERFSVGQVLQLERNPAFLD